MKALVIQLIPKKIFSIGALFLFLILSCRKHDPANDPLTGNDIYNNLPGIYQGPVKVTYPGPIPYLIYNDVKVTLKNSPVGVGFLRAYPGFYFHTDSDMVKIDTVISDYWKVIADFKLVGPRSNLIYADSNLSYKLHVNYFFYERQLVVDYQDLIKKQSSHFVGNKISN